MQQEIKLLKDKYDLLDLKNQAFEVKLCEQRQFESHHNISTNETKHIEEVESRIMELIS